MFIFYISFREIFLHEGSRENLNEITPLSTEEATQEREATAHQVFLQHSSYRADLHGDFLREPETSFMDTVNKILLLSKPKCSRNA